MSLTLYYHPLSSFCLKVLFALYENEIPFTPRLLNLQDPDESANFHQLWPIGNMPVLQDEARKMTVPETTIILEYLDRNYPGKRKLFPDDPDHCQEARLWDRILDLYLHLPMQKIVGDRLRPADARDPHGIAEAQATMKDAYDLLERQLETREWIVGEAMSVADCAAFPALFYGGIVRPFADTHPRVVAYFERLLARPAVRRLLAEGKPFFQYFPYIEKMPARFR